VKFAVNPLQWAALPDGDLDPRQLPPLAELLQILADLGFSAVHTLIDRPTDIDRYAAALLAAGLEAAPGYFAFPFEDRTAVDQATRRAEDAADTHQALGLDHIFIADTLNSIRVARPGRGEAADPRRLPAMAANLASVCEVFTHRAVTPCLHQHVASWVETEEEYLHMLKLIDPALLAAGPDTGHLAYADADPTAVIRALAGRVRVAHLKDLHAAVKLETADRDYFAAVASGLWTEPGRGDVDLERVITVLRDLNVDWAIVEVDRPDGVDAFTSAARCTEWIRRHH
jgi:inosose dehydratase